MKLAKKAAALMLLLCIIILCGVISDAAVQIPEKIKIGLFYDSTSLDTFTVSAEKGLQIGISGDNGFVPLVQEASNTELTVQKDASYAIRLPGAYDSLQAVNAQLKTYQEKGIDAYPAYADSWQIWTGLYADKTEAQKEITEKIQVKLGPEEYPVIAPSPARIMILSPKREVVLAFDSGAGFLQFQPAQENVPAVLSVNGKTYRGSVEVQRLTVSDMTVINVVGLEEYLYGVVPAEIEGNSSVEALKAQAVAARTYAVKNMGKQKKWGFDLSGGTADQIYKGFGGEVSATNQAVDETRGKIVLYDGKVAEVFYFSSSGGMTESAKNVYGVDIPYLVSVEDKYESAASRNYTWDKTLTSDDLKAMLDKKGNNIGDILSIEVTKTSDAGRPIEVLVKGTKGEQKFVNSACRSAFGLDSQWYTISTDADVMVRETEAEPLKTQLTGKKVMTASGVKTVAATASASSALKVVDGSNNIKKLNLVPTTYTLSGRGWGHAVGMSQEGAKGMAKAGYTYEEILTHYFPGTTID